MLRVQLIEFVSLITSTNFFSCKSCLECFNLSGLLRIIYLDEYMTEEQRKSLYDAIERMKNGTAKTITHEEVIKRIEEKFPFLNEYQKPAKTSNF